MSKSLSQIVVNKRSGITAISIVSLVACAAIFGYLGTRSTSKSAAATPTTSAGLSSMYLNSAQANAMGDTSRYQYVILQDYMYARIPAIKAANPNTKVLAYKNMVASSSDCSADAHPAQGVSYCDAQTNHPDWFLHQNGQPFTLCEYSYLYWMDIGNAAYQQAWIDNVKASVRSDGFDGVFMDDTNFHPAHCKDGNKLEQYTDDQYGQAMAGFASQVGDAMKADNLLAVANMGANPWTNSEESKALQVAPHLSAFFREHFMHWQSSIGGRFTGANWSYVMAQMEAVENSTAYIANTYPESTTDTQTMRYGRASFLLAWNGRSDSASQVRPGGNADPYNSEWGADVGTPIGTRTQAGVAWKRTFSGGIVVVNPDPAQTATVSLGGSYLNQAGQTITSITLASGDAAILKSPPPSHGTVNGDFNGDGVVNIFDLGVFLGCYNQNDVRGDLNSDSVVNIFDLGKFLGYYGQGH
jgi:hypothetical protein